MDVKLIINADDYAISPGVSAGIRELICAGRVSATSCMTGSEYWRDDGERLRSLDAPPFSAGLHVTLTDQAACAASTSLAPDGRLPSLGQLWRGILSGKIRRGDLEKEIHAQIDRFIDIYDCPPGHIDGHHHVQQLPIVRDIILALWRDGVVNDGAWLRVSADTVPRIVKRGTDRAKALAIALAGSGLRAAATRRGIAVNDGFAGVYDLQPGSDFAAVCASALGTPSSRMVFMCHPGHADEALVGKDSVTYQRDEEFRYLMSAPFGDLLSGFSDSLVARFE